MWLAQTDPLGSLSTVTGGGALAVLVVVLAFVGKSIRDASQRQQAELERRDAENERLRRENDDLRAQVMALALGHLAPWDPSLRKAIEPDVDDEGVQG